MPGRSDSILASYGKGKKKQPVQAQIEGASSSCLQLYLKKPRLSFSCGRAQSDAGPA